MLFRNLTTNLGRRNNREQWRLVVKEAKAHPEL
jgi:hypothetical protein